MNGQELTTRSGVSVSLILNTLPQLREFCQVLAKTGMVPKAYQEKPDDILVAMLHGQEVGLPHLQALQSIAVVNGIPSIYGDAALAMVRASGKLEDFDEWIEVEGVRQDGPFPIMKFADEGKSIVAMCQSKRVGMSRDRVTTYSVDDAQRAKLWMKKGHNGFETPWCTVPQRMLMWRARGWNLRDQFGDVLKGLAIYEEAMDVEVSRGPDGVYRAPMEFPEGQSDADMQRIQDVMTKRPTPAAETAPDVPAKQESLSNNGLATQVEISDEDWNEAIRQIDEHPDLRDLKERVKAAMKLKTLRVTAPAKIGFIRQFTHLCEQEGFGNLAKRIFG